MIKWNATHTPYQQAAPDSIRQLLVNIMLDAVKGAQGGNLDDWRWLMGYSYGGVTMKMCCAKLRIAPQVVRDYAQTLPCALVARSETDDVLRRQRETARRLASKPVKVTIGVRQCYHCERPFNPTFERQRLCNRADCKSWRIEKALR